MNCFHKLIQCLFLVFITSALLVISSCKKFLDQKPKVSLIVPHTLSDLQLLLDNRSVINQRSAAGYAQFLSDDYYEPEVYYDGFYKQIELTQGYVWHPNAPGIVAYWRSPYTGPVYYSNIALDQLPDISYELKDSNVVNAQKGSALFYRAFAFYNLAQVYCRPYDAQYLSYPGIVLRLNSDASIIERHRSTVGETYTRIINDLKEAAGLLPKNTEVPTRPCQAAAYAALARVYLSMRDYTNSALYAHLALQQRSTLLDYNTRIPVPSTPFITFNVEVIFDDVGADPDLFTNPGFGCIDSNLYSSYDGNDLRKVLYFKMNNNGSYRWNGSYNSTVFNYPGNLFDGLATDELYLVRAECSARAGNKDSALADLNRLMIKRWNNTVPYPAITATNATDALAKILVERRKELVNRGQRWMDIRRLNLEGANITLKRVIHGITYTLSPNDVRTVVLIPEEEIAKSGIEQNSR